MRIISCRWKHHGLRRCDVLPMGTVSPFWPCLLDKLLDKTKIKPRKWLMGTDKMCWYKWEHKQLFSLRHRVCPSASPFFSWLNHVEAPFSTRNAPCFMVKPAGACQGEDVDASDSFCRGEPRWMSTMSTKDRNSHTWNSVYCRCRCGCRCIFFELTKNWGSWQKIQIFWQSNVNFG